VIAFRVRFIADLPKRALPVLLSIVVIHWQVNEALPVNISPLAGVAVIVTGLATAAVQVAVTCVAWAAERWTEGSLTVQLEFTSAAVTAGHPGLFLN
jgi:hypothetical protein